MDRLLLIVKEQKEGNSSRTEGSRYENTVCVHQVFLYSGAAIYANKATAANQGTLKMDATTAQSTSGLQRTAVDLKGPQKT